MNKVCQYLYTIVFWTLRFITLFFFGISFFAVLNAKYAYSATFFTRIINISLYISYYIHKLFNSNDILSVLNMKYWY